MWALMGKERLNVLQGALDLSVEITLVKNLPLFVDACSPRDEVVRTIAVGRPRSPFEGDPVAVCRAKMALRSHESDLRRVEPTLEQRIRGNDLIVALHLAGNTRARHVVGGPCHPTMFEQFAPRFDEALVVGINVTDEEPGPQQAVAKRTAMTFCHALELLQQIRCLQSGGAGRARTKGAPSHLIAAVVNHELAAGIETAATGTTSLHVIRL